MSIRCEECKRDFIGTKTNPALIYICRFCMGEGLDPKKYYGGNREAAKVLDEILNETWLLTRRDLDRLLAKIKEAREILK